VPPTGGPLRVPLVVAAVGLCFIGVASAHRFALPLQDQPQARVTSPEDEAAVRSVIESYYAAYGRGDLDTMMALWHPSAPGVRGLRIVLEHAFGTETYAFSNLAIASVKADVSGGTARVTIDVVVRWVPTGITRRERWVRNQSFLQRDGVWRFWRDVPAVEDLGFKLASAPTDGDREALLATEPQLANDDLLEAVEAAAMRRNLSHDPARALELYDFAERLALRTDNQTGLARVLFGVGQFHQQRKNFPEALQSFERARNAFVALKDRAGVARVLFSTGLLYQQQQDWPEALLHFEQARDAFILLKDRPSLALSETNIGSALYAQNQARRALEHYLAAATLFEEQKDETWLASTFHNLGNTYYLLGNLTQALDSYRRCLQIQEKTGNAAGVASVQLALGLVHKDRGDYPSAVDAYRAGLEQYERAGNKAGVVPTLQGIAEVYRLQGYYDFSLQHARRALQVAEEIRDEQAIGLLLFDIGRTLAAERRWPAALNAYEKSLSFDEQLRNQASVARTLAAIGIVYFAQAKYDQALEVFRRSLVIRENNDDKPRVAWTLVHIGMTLEAQGDHEGALAAYQRSITVNEATANRNGVSIGLALTADTHLAIEDATGALAFAERAAALAAEVSDLDTYAHARLTIGKTHRLLKDLDLASSAVEDAVAAVEKMAAADVDRPAEGFFGETLSPYVAMADLLAAQGRAQEALAYAERGRSCLLRNVLGTSASRIARGLSRQERSEEQRLSGELVSLATQIEKEKGRAAPDRERLAALELDLSTTRGTLELLRSTVFAAHPILKVQRGRADPAAFVEVAALLADTGAAALEYVVMADRVLAFAIAQPPGPTAGSGNRALFPGLADAPAVVARAIDIRVGELATRVRAFRDHIEQKSPEVEPEARALYELLIKPVERCFSGSARLVVIPDGVLWALPFEALEPTAGRFLVEDRAISYAPSLSAFTWTTRLAVAGQGDGKRPPSVLALGNATPGKALLDRFAQTRPELKLDPMPAAEREVRLVTALYGPARALLYTAAGARKDRARSQAANHTVFHAAVDGVLSDASPMYSELVFSPPSPEHAGSTVDDGAVTAAELLDWDLPVEEAILSRLRSETGSQTTGEGTIGLSWALYVAGCPTAVLSRWRAESPAAPALMLELHRALKGSSTPPTPGRAAADALRKATLRLMRTPRYRHPYYWAGFFVMGAVADVALGLQRERPRFDRLDCCRVRTPVGHVDRKGTTAARLEQGTRQRQEASDDPRAEPRARLPGEQAARSVEGERLAIGARAGERVERVHDADDAHGPGDAAGGQAVRVAGPVGVFVVVEDHLGNLVGEPQSLDQIGPQFRVAAQLVPLALGQPTGLGEQPRWDQQLASVVEEGADADRLDHLGGKAVLHGQPDRVRRHPPGVQPDGGIDGLDDAHERVRVTEV
jgi:CHAT domain-containing protein/tetratricopeptide (TPR) repeat protein